MSCMRKSRHNLKHKAVRAVLRQDVEFLQFEALVAVRAGGYWFAGMV